jgi:hypothetical protein
VMLSLLAFGLVVLFCQIVCRVVLEMLPERWAWSSTFGRAWVNAAVTGRSVVVFGRAMLYLRSLYMQKY